MKHLTSFFISLLIATCSFAQQALWSGSQIISPEINQDNSVTFRLHAPKAVKVLVTGDFTEAGYAELVEKDGIWTYTTAPLSPELYSYSFVVDGLTVRDPSNVYMIRDVASVTNVFIVGGSRADLYKVNDVPHGSVSKVWYHSPTLGMNRRMTVYTPAGYEQNRRQKYPVFYLLHGAGGDEEAWMDLGRTSQILDNLIAQGKAEPMIVVMTNGNAGESAAPGQCPDGFERIPGFQQRGMMEGSFEMHFPDVVKYIESNYRVFKDKKHRAIAGLSMGGFHSMHISKYYPDMFDYVGLFSAAARFHENSDCPVYMNEKAQIDAQFAKKPALYWIAIGNTDFLYQENVKFRNYLDEKGYRYEYVESEGGHIWKNWRIYLTEFVPKLFR
ncbi:MAG: esterase [Bacteroidales bacterium]|nr:esterase [Bacteroidales bacterium]